MGHERRGMMRKKSAGKAITAAIVFIGIFGLLTKYGIYAAAVLAIYVTARIIKSLNGD
jgi:hypothetical protein